MTRVHLAANQGHVGGGETMLLLAAAACRDLGLHPVVVAPAEPGETLAAAAAAGFDTVGVPGSGRAAYARQLRRWDRTRHGLLWCHGLVPAAATARHPQRLVQLHQEPSGLLQRIAATAAASGAVRVLVPSAFMTGRVRDSIELANWTADVAAPRRGAPPVEPVETTGTPPVEPVETTSSSTRRTGGQTGGPAVVGFLGRFSQDKGLDVLARAVALLQADGRDVQLLLGGDSRFVPDAQRAAVAAALDEVGRNGPPVDDRGWISRDDFFAAVDLAVFPSVWQEPFGLVAAEAMAARVPFVVSSAGALPEVAGPGHPWVSRPGDPADLAAVIGAALDASTADLERAIAAARARWEQHYSPAAGRERVADLLRSVGVLGQEVST